MKVCVPVEHVPSLSVQDHLWSASALWSGMSCNHNHDNVASLLTLEAPCLHFVHKQQIALIIIWGYPDSLAMPSMCGI